jgi:hypothetical protein
MNRPGSLLDPRGVSLGRGWSREPRAAREGRIEEMYRFGWMDGGERVTGTGERGIVRDCKGGVGAVWCRGVVGGVVVGVECVKAGSDRLE